MLRTIRNALLLALSLAGGAWVYHWGVAGEDRYTVFDLLQGKPAPAAIPGKATGTEALEPNPAEGEKNSESPGGADETGTTEPDAEAAGKADATSRPGGPVALDLNSTELLHQVNLALADLTDKVVPAVVSIDTTTTVEVPRYQAVDPFGLFGYRRFNQRMEAPGLGSGVIVSEEGHVLTNHHVVAGVDAIRITLHSGDVYDAEWVGSDPAADVAVLKISVPEEVKTPPELHPLEFGNSDEVRVGDMALAVGNPFGLSESVTRGIISAKQRRLSDGGNEYFQTDAVINPGNSGGPLIDIHGRIIGINTAIFTGQQDVRVWQGIGLAIPANEAREVYEAIAFNKPLIRGYLGLSLDDLNAGLARVLRLRTTRGALVTHVDDDSPADQAGLLPGDFIVTFDGAEVTSAEDALQRIRRKKAGADVTMTVIRKGEPVDLEVTVTERPDTTTLQLRSDITASGQSIAETLGLVVRDLSPSERQAFGLRDEHPAILISDVQASSQANEGGLRPGDLIHAINRDPVHNVAEFYDLLGSLPKKRNSVIILTRQGRRIDVYLNPGA